MQGFKLNVPVGNPPPETLTVGPPVKILFVAGTAIAVVTPFVNVHVVVV